MALEQNTRGLNARICALERSLSEEIAPQRVDPDVGYSERDNRPDNTNTIDDFVPAQGINLASDSQPKQGTQVSITEIACKQGTKPGKSGISILEGLPVDATALVSGIMLVLISVLLYSGNMELLKNPVVPMGFGVILIGYFCARWYIK